MCPMCPDPWHPVAHRGIVQQEKPSFHPRRYKNEPGTTRSNLRISLRNEAQGQAQCNPRRQSPLDGQGIPGRRCLQHGLGGTLQGQEDCHQHRPFRELRRLLDDRPPQYPRGIQVRHRHGKPGGTRQGHRPGGRLLPQDRREGQGQERHGGVHRRRERMLRPPCELSQPFREPAWRELAPRPFQHGFR